MRKCSAEQHYRSPKLGIETETNVRLIKGHALPQRHQTYPATPVAAAVDRGKRTYAKRRSLSPYSV